MSNLQQIIKNWIGEGKGLMDLDNENFYDGEVEIMNNFSIAYNKALEDINSRVPELVEEINRRTNQVMLDNIVFIEDQGQFFKRNVIDLLTSE